MFEGYKVIDVHSHQTTPSEFSDAALFLMRLRHHDRPFTLTDERLSEALQTHIELIDGHQIDVQLLSPRPVDMMHWEVPDIQKVWCRITNEVTAQSCRLFPGRFAGMAQLPQHRDIDTSNCVAELERCVREHGFVGAIVNPDPGADGKAPGMADRYWYPLYEKAQELGAVLMVHSSYCRDERIQMVPHNYQINNYVGQFYATVELEHGDVFTDFPDLHVYICHLGGVLNRFHSSDTMHQYGTKHLDNLYFDTCVYDPDYLTLGIKQKGVDRILFGSEAPGSGSFTRLPDTGRLSDDLVPVIAELPSLTQQDRIDIFHNNALRFCSLLKV